MAEADDKQERLSQGKAEELNDEIRSAADKLQDAVEAYEYEWDELTRLLTVAKAGHIWEVLGYDSWAAYCVESVGLNPSNIQERRQLVALLIEVGNLSTRAIGRILDVSHDTVWRDAQLSDRLKELSDQLTVESLDGKERPRKQNPTNKRDRSKPDLPPMLVFTKAFNTTSEDLSKLIQRIDTDGGIAVEAARELPAIREMRDSLNKLIRRLSKVEVTE